MTYNDTRKYIPTTMTVATHDDDNHPQLSNPMITPPPTPQTTTTTTKITIGTTPTTKTGTKTTTPMTDDDTPHNPYEAFLEAHEKSSREFHNKLMAMMRESDMAIRRENKAFYTGLKAQMVIIVTMKRNNNKKMTAKQQHIKRT